ncbi:MAG: ComEC/Rec2 family competence protein [Chloroflexi bacterium]|nr:ComEC/Rec2 family competence protein [Chloroflexota bacterium]
MTLVRLSAAFALGVTLPFLVPSFIHGGWHPSQIVYALFIVGAGLMGIVARRSGTSLLIPVLLGLVVLGAWRATDFGSAVLLPYEWRDGDYIEFEGISTHSASPFGSGQAFPVHFVAISGTTDLPDEKLEISIIADLIIGQLPDNHSRFHFAPGDRYLISGEFDEKGLRGTSGRVYASSVRFIEESDSGLSGRIDRIRANLADNLRSALPEPHAGLAAALVVGDRSRLDDGLRQSFRSTGTSHLIAISGLHIGVVGFLVFLASASLLGRRRQLYLLLPFLTVWAYAVMAGLSDPIVRSSVMFTLFLAAHLAGRQRSPFPALALAAAVMLAVEPSAIAEPSFQLSFGSLLGILWFAPQANRLVNKYLPLGGTNRSNPATKFVRGVVIALLIGAAATTVTTPIVAFHFHAVPIWGILATVFALPAMLPAILGSLLTGIMGTVWSTPADVASWPTWLALEYMITVIEFFEKLPFSTIDVGRVTAAALAMIYVVGIGYLLRKNGLSVWRRTVEALRDGSIDMRLAPLHRHRLPMPILLVTVGLAALSLAAVTTQSGSELRVTFSETTRGDLSLIETPGGRQILIDGGGSPDGAVKFLGDRMPFWDHSLDLVILTHPHADHVTGLLRVLETYDIDRILHAPIAYDSRVYGAWLNETEPLADRVLIAQPGITIAFGDGSWLEVLHSGPTDYSTDPNDGSVVLRISYGDVSFLMTGDASTVVETHLLASGVDLSADVLKVPHQGSKGSSSTGFVNAVSPVIAVIPVGSENPFGHPHQEAVDRLSAVVPADQLFNTSIDGTITVTTNGKRLWVYGAK